MADVRSLLRNELATRKEASQTGSTGTRFGKKRKVDNDDDLNRKRMKSTAAKAEKISIKPPSAQNLNQEEEHAEQDAAGPEPPSEKDRQEATQDDTEPSTTPPIHPKTSQPQTVDEDEWAAFEREVAEPSRMPQAPAAISAPATISAAPMSAEEIAAQQDREKAAVGPSREAEVEGEREDAARFLEEEFDEMDQLEERVKRLKQKREELRKKRTPGNLDVPEQVDKSPPAESKELKENPTATVEGASHGEDDEDEDDDWDNWRFR